MISCLRPQKVWFFQNLILKKSSPWTAALPSSFRKSLKLKLQLMRIPVGFYLCFRTGKTTDGPSFSACSFTWPTHRGGTPPRTLGVSHPTQPLPPLDGIKARQIDIRHRSRRVVQLPNLSSPKGHLHQQAEGWNIHGWGRHFCWRTKNAWD